MTNPMQAIRLDLAAIQQELGAKDVRILQLQSMVVALQKENEELRVALDGYTTAPETPEEVASE